MYYPKALSKNERSKLVQAAEIATHSTCNQRHGAILFKGKRVFAIGINRFRNHPSTVSRPSIESSVHAEIAALKSLGSSAKGLTIAIARVNKKGEPVDSHPCDACLQALKEAGVRRIIYTKEGIIDQ